MAEMENRETVMILTNTYRILGTMRLGPDGTIWDFKHKAEDDLVTVYDAQCFRLSDGKRMYDSSAMQVNKRAVEVLFRQQNLGFARKEAT